MSEKVLGVEGNGQIAEKEISAGAPPFKITLPTTLGLIDNFILPGWAGHYGTATDSVVLVAETLYYGPIYVYPAIRFLQIGINVKTSDSGSSIRLGLYSPDSKMFPGSLLLDAGEVSSASTGTKSIVIDQTLEGFLWTCFISDGTPAVRFLNYGAVGPTSMLTYRMTGTHAAYSLQAQGVSYGALPATAPSPNAQNSGLYAQSVRFLPDLS